MLNGRRVSRGFVVLFVVLGLPTTSACGGGAGGPSTGLSREQVDTLNRGLDRASAAVDAWAAALDECPGAANAKSGAAIDPGFRRCADESYHRLGVKAALTDVADKMDGMQSHLTGACNMYLEMAHRSVTAWAGGLDDIHEAMVAGKPREIAHDAAINSELNAKMVEAMNAVGPNC